MRIGIDISTLLNNGKDIGAGRYIFNLIKNMLLINKKDTFVLTGRYFTSEYLSIIDELKAFSEKEKDTQMVRSQPAIDAIETIENKKRIEFKLFRVGTKKLNIWDRFNFPPIEMLGFNSDILHCPDFLIAPTKNKNIILTIHDLAFVRFPHFNFDWFVKKYTKEVKRNSDRAKRIIAVSQSTKNDIVEFFKVDETKIDVIYEAAEEKFKKLNENEIDRSLLEKYKITKKFILSVGTIEPRKNYATLIKAFNLLKCLDKDFEYQLVIVGRTGWLSETAYNEFENSPYKNDIIFTSRISDNELIHIYNMAEIFVYPSIFEGFGLPVIEAMQCGLPVAASNVSSIPEIVEEKEFLFNPADEEDIAEKINKLLKLLKKDKEQKERLSQVAIKNASKFSWRQTAEKTLNVYKKLA